MTRDEFQNWAKHRAIDIVEAGHGPFLESEIERALNEAYTLGRSDGIREAAAKCCTIDSSDSSHETAESNAAAILALLSEGKS